MVLFEESYGQHFKDLCTEKPSFMMTSLFCVPKGTLLAGKQLYLCGDTVFYTAVVTQSDYVSLPLFIWKITVAYLIILINSCELLPVQIFLSLN